MSYLKVTTKKKKKDGEEEEEDNGLIKILATILQELFSPHHLEQLPFENRTKLYCCVKRLYLQSLLLSNSLPFTNPIY